LDEYAVGERLYDDPSVQAAMMVIDKLTERLEAQALILRHRHTMGAKVGSA
jgi:hypothetical protein